MHSKCPPLAISLHGRIPLVLLPVLLLRVPRPALLRLPLARQFGLALPLALARKQAVRSLIGD